MRQYRSYGGHVRVGVSVHCKTCSTVQRYKAKDIKQWWRVDATLYHPNADVPG